jgi:ABC-type nitrate/sulfonate/bicarbonate transport system ATPase subunit
VHPEKSKSDRIAMAMASLEMVGLTDAAQKKPKQLSGGMRQRVSIARALSIRPKVLILDEPFGALDVLTREELQEELLKIWREHKVTVMMITHDIDEAIFLSDRIVMMTNGPAATIGEVVDIPFARPRNREVITEDPRFFTIRNHALDFLFHRFALADDAH